MRRFTAAVILAVTLLASGLVSAPAGAVIGPTSSDAQWVAYIEIRNPVTSETGGCTGSLIAPNWVLTAAHCVAELDENLNDYVVSDPKHVTVFLGRSTGERNGKGQRYKVDRIETRRYRQLLEPVGHRDDDVALLHLKKASDLEPVWLLPGQGVAEPGVELQLNGFGRTGSFDDPAHDGTSGVLRATKPGGNSLYSDCAAATDGVVCALASPVDGAYSAGGAGDSGALWVRELDGRDFGVFVFSGYTGPDEDELQYQYGESVFNDLTISWVRDYAGIPTPFEGRIVRDPATEEAWLIDSDLFRRPIPDGGTYECLVGRGANVVNLPTESLRLMPARTLDATCGGGGGVLLVDLDEDDGDSAAVASILADLGFDATLSEGLPGDLDQFDQIWVFATFTGYSQDARTRLSAYVAGGGSLLANGEWVCCSQTNSTLEAIMDSVLEADVTLVSASHGVRSAFPLEPTAVDAIGTTPNNQPSLSVDAYGEQEGVPAANVLLLSGDIVLASVWTEAEMRSGTGRLITIMDSNWSDASRIASNPAAIENFAAFLGRG